MSYIIQYYKIISLIPKILESILYTRHFCHRNQTDIS